MDWKIPAAAPPTTIQQVVLNEAGKDGLTTCKELINPLCGNDGFDRDLCLKYPEAHFVWASMTNWANWLHGLSTAWGNCASAVGPALAAIRRDFYTPSTNLNKFLVPVGVISGIAGAISGFLGPVALVAGAGSVASAFITQAGLDQVE